LNAPLQILKPTNSLNKNGGVEVGVGVIVGVGVGEFVTSTILTSTSHSTDEEKRENDIGLIITSSDGVIVGVTDGVGEGQAGQSISKQSVIP
jgi:hypothetical protein